MATTDFFLFTSTYMRRNKSIQNIHSYTWNILHYIHYIVNYDTQIVYVLYFAISRADEQSMND